MNTKRIISGGLLLALGAALIAPSPTYAAERERSTVPAKTNFCVQFSTKSATLEKNINDRQAKLAAAQADRDAKIDQRRADRDARLETARTAADARREQQLANLNSKATSDTQKAAIAAFQSALQSALSARKAAVNTAMKAFRDGIDQNLASRKSAANTAVSNYKNALSAATTKAQGDCTAGVAPATVRSTFLAAVKSAKAKLREDRKALEKLGPQATALAKVRNAAVQKAVSDFKIAMEKARADLKTALGK